MESVGSAVGADADFCYPFSDKTLTPSPFCHIFLNILMSNSIGWFKMIKPNSTCSGDVTDEIK